MELSNSEVATFGFRCVTFRSEQSQISQPYHLNLAGKSFLIDQNECYVCQHYYKTKTSRYQILRIPYPLDWIYPAIHILYDKNGREIARRIGRGQPLLQNPRINLKRRLLHDGGKHSSYKNNVEQSHAG